MAAAFNWNDFLTLAKRLVVSDDEAALRTAISRAYYAAFQTAHEVSHDVRVTIPAVTHGRRVDKSEHVRVINALRKHSHYRLQRAGGLLAEMRAWRNRADYEIRFDGNVREVAQRAIDHSDLVIFDLDCFIRGV